MSIEVALDNINLKPSSMWGHTEYSFNYHVDYLARRTGLSRDNPKLLQRGHDLFAFDFIWNTNDGIVDGTGTELGHENRMPVGMEENAKVGDLNFLNRFAIAQEDESVEKGIGFGVGIQEGGRKIILQGQHPKRDCTTLFIEGMPFERRASVDAGKVDADPVAMSHSARGSVQDMEWILGRFVKMNGLGKFERRKTAHIRVILILIMVFSS